MADRTAEIIWGQTGNTATGSIGKSDSPKSNTYTNAPGGAGANINGKKGIPWPGKSQAINMANWKALATPRNMAKSLIGPGAVISIAGSSVIGWLLSEACVRVAGGTMQLRDGGQWEECVFESTEVTAYQVSGHEQTKSASIAEACTKMTTVVYALSDGSYSEVVVDPGNPLVPFCHSVAANGNTRSMLSITVAGTITRQVQTGWAPISPAAAEDKFETDIQEACAAGSPNCSGLLKDILDSGGSVDVADPELDGPASVEGTPTTKTETDTNPQTGQPREKTTTTTTINNYTYEGDTITRTTITTTTITYSDGSATETKTEVEDDKRDRCEKDPSAIGCDGSLDVPDGEIPKTTKVLTYAAEALGFGAGACPADIVRNVGGQAMTVFSYAQGCVWIVNYGRPMVLMLAAWIAFLILSPGGGRPQ